MQSAQASQSTCLMGCITRSGRLIPCVEVLDLQSFQTIHGLSQPPFCNSGVYFHPRLQLRPILCRLDRLRTGLPSVRKWECRQCSCNPGRGGRLKQYRSNMKDLTMNTSAESWGPSLFYGSCLHRRPQGTLLDCFTILLSGLPP